ncbi:MAG: histone family protein DNA-binding protein [Deltaproteobacteria bacterium]|jgi:integration host factor subunit beta|nr:histone family protein DNA-binding protein [Deltaproteobacteria bacterium]HYR03033.1 HU family DNA-binding protein [Syntrophobacteria bacterium]
MTRRELIAATAAAEGIPLKEAEQIVRTVFGAIEQALISRDRVEIRGFGSFKVKEYRGYRGRNPRTGTPIEVKEKRLPFFKVGKELKSRVTGE